MPRIVNLSEDDIRSFIAGANSRKKCLFENEKRMLSSLRRHCDLVHQRATNIEEEITRISYDAMGCALTAENRYSSESTDDPNFQIQKDYERITGKIRSRCEEISEKTGEIFSVCEKIYDQIKDVEDFIRKAELLVAEKIDEICDSSLEAINDLASAKERFAPLPARRDDIGTVDIDGLSLYINNIAQAISECSSDYNQLSRVTDDLNYGWSDDVYRHFKRKVNVDIKDSLIQITETFKKINDALSSMKIHLERYYYRQPYVSSDFISMEVYDIDIHGSSGKKYEFKFEV